MKKFYQLNKLLFLVIAFLLFSFVNSTKAQVSCDSSLESLECSQGGICINCPSGAPSYCGNLNGYFCIQDPNSCSLWQPYNYNIGRCDVIPCSYGSPSCPSGSVCNAPIGNSGHCVEESTFTPSAEHIVGGMGGSSCQTNDDCLSGFECIFVSMTEGKRCSPKKINSDDSDNKVIFTPQITIPGSDFKKGIDFEIEESTKTIGNYIKAIHNYLLAIVGLLATIVLMASGIIWMTAGGNTERISQAKGWMTGALTGLVLMLFSYIVLRTINPKLVDFKVSTIENVEEIKINQSVASKNQIPKDTRLETVCTKKGYRCQNVSMNNQNTSLITVEDSACVEHFGETEWEERRSDCVISSNEENYLYCCGSSETEKNERNNFCKNKNNGTSCYMSMTDKLKTGYCENGQCKQCISGLDYQGAGQKCTKSYQCATNNAGSCGNDGGGACMLYVMDVLGSLSNYGYCKVEYSENSCEGTVGGGCKKDSCCPGLCCSHVGIWPGCIPGQKIDGSNNCKYE